MPKNGLELMRTQDGFGLMQVLVSVAIMSVIMAGTATMMQQMGRSQKTQDSKAAFITLGAAIRSQLMYKDNCLASIPSGIPNMTTVAPASLQAITISVPPATIAANQYLDEYRLQVNFVRLANFQPFGVVTGPLRFHFADIELSVSTDKLGSDEAGGQEDRFQFNKAVAARIIFESDAAGTVQSCYAVDESVNITQLIESFCASMGLTIGAGTTCQIAPRVREVIHAAGSCPADYLFNGTDASGAAVCVPKSHIMGSVGSCPAGQYVSGISPTGAVNCAALPAQQVAAGGFPGGYMMTGANASGPICSPVPTAPPSPVGAGSCPAGQSVVALNSWGPTCASSSPAANVNCSSWATGGMYVSGMSWVQGFDANGVPYCGGIYPSVSCFTAETKIRMYDGTEKPIHEVRVGDWVMSGWDEPNEVLGVEVVPLAGRQLFGVNRDQPFFTHEHPFATHEGWKSVSPEATFIENSKLAVGYLEKDDYLRTERGWKRLQSLRTGWLPPETRVYNLILSGDHSYVANGYVVHNKN